MKVTDGTKRGPSQGCAGGRGERRGQKQRKHDKNLGWEMASKKKRVTFRNRSKSKGVGFPRQGH